MEKPTRVDKGWGYELIIANNENYCGKMLHVQDGKKCSMHFHVKKHETFYIVRGCVIMRLILKGGMIIEKTMSRGDMLEVPQGLMHQFKGIGDADIMEVSTFHDDEDSYRIEKGD